MRRRVRSAFDRFHLAASASVGGIVAPPPPPPPPEHGFVIFHDDDGHAYVLTRAGERIRYREVT